MNPKISEVFSWTIVIILIALVAMLASDDIQAESQAPISTVIIVSKEMYDIKIKADAYVRQGYKIKLIESQSVASGTNTIYKGEVILVLEK